MAKSMAKLSYCERCKEDSVKVKLYRKEDGSRGRVEYCINKGCKYKLDTTIQETTSAMPAQGALSAESAKGAERSSKNVAMQGNEEAG